MSNCSLRLFFTKFSKSNVHKKPRKIHTEHLHNPMKIFWDYQSNIIYFGVRQSTILLNFYTKDNKK